MIKLRRTQKTIMTLLTRKTPFLPDFTYEEIKQAIGLKSKSGVAVHMRHLTEKGYIYREKWQKGYTILKDADGRQIRPPIDPLKEQVKKVCEKLAEAEQQLRGLL